MHFRELSVPGVILVELEPDHDDRGHFARCFAEEAFAELGLPTRFPHWNLSHNTLAGTLRGMHYAVAPSAEAKLVRCVSGAVYDVVVDVRAGSPTFGVWTYVELSAQAGQAVFVPAGCAHGFLTLTDRSDVLYQMSEVFRPDTQRGFRWNELAFGISWPGNPRAISPRDAEYEDFAWPCVSVGALTLAHATPEGRRGDSTR